VEGGREAHNREQQYNNNNHNTTTTQHTSHTQHTQTTTFSHPPPLTPSHALPHLPTHTTHTTTHNTQHTTCTTTTLSRPLTPSHTLPAAHQFFLFSGTPDLNLNFSGKVQTYKYKDFSCNSRSTFSAANFFKTSPPIHFTQAWTSNKNTVPPPKDSPTQRETTERGGKPCPSSSSHNTANVMYVERMFLLCLLVMSGASRRPWGPGQGKTGAPPYAEEQISYVFLAVSGTLQDGFPLRSNLDYWPNKPSNFGRINATFLGNVLIRGMRAYLDIKPEGSREYREVLAEKSVNPVVLPTVCDVYANQYALYVVDARQVPLTTLFLLVLVFFSFFLLPPPPPSSSSSPSPSSSSSSTQHNTTQHNTTHGTNSTQHNRRFLG